MEFILTGTNEVAMLRLITNMFDHEHSLKVLLQYISPVLTFMEQCLDTHQKSVQLSLGTALLNFSLLVATVPLPLSIIQLVTKIIFRLYVETEDLEAAQRALLALGTQFCGQVLSFPNKLELLKVILEEQQNRYKKETEKDKGKENENEMATLVSQVLTILQRYLMKKDRTTNSGSGSSSGAGSSASSGASPWTKIAATFAELQILLHELAANEKTN
jgi:hypothetical protein